MTEPSDILQTKTRRALFKNLALVFLVVSVCGAGYIHFLITAPKVFTQGTALEVFPGMSVRDIAESSQEHGLVRSESFLYILLTYSYDPTAIYAGTYIFEEPTSVFGVAKKLAGKDIETNLVSLTIPEGISVKEVAEIASRILPDFSTEIYTASTSELEGYLFPETYFIPPTFTAQNLLLLQQKIFEESIAPFKQDISSSHFTEYEILILASIIEREANDEQSMRMVSGILQNRLNIGMPLQADASIEYVLDTPLKELPAGKLASELRETQSPYNTYLNTGLPPTPIGNPGIMAIEAVIHPTVSDNFYYITDPTGIFHYAETYREHNQNIAKYLR